MPPKGETEEDKNKLSPKHKLSDDEVNDKISGIAIGSAFHYKKTSPSKVKEHLLKNNLEVRS